MIKKLKKLERKHYPASYRQMQHCSTMEEVVEYCEALDIHDLVIMTGDSWYFLAVRSTGEIVDLAGKMKLSDLFAINRKIRDIFTGRIIKLDAREKTSWRVARRLGQIISDQRYKWENEYFHELEILIG